VQLQGDYRQLAVSVSAGSQNPGLLRTGMSEYQGTEIISHLVCLFIHFPQKNTWLKAFKPAAQKSTRIG
jgi:hypothetical protein